MTMLFPILINPILNIGVYNELKSLIVHTEILIAISHQRKTLTMKTVSVNDITVNVMAALYVCSASYTFIRILNQYIRVIECLYTRNWQNLYHMGPMQTA